MGRLVEFIKSGFPFFRLGFHRRSKVLLLYFLVQVSHLKDLIFFFTLYICSSRGLVNSQTLPILYALFPFTRFDSYSFSLDTYIYLFHPPFGISLIPGLFVSVLFIF